MSEFLQDKRAETLPGNPVAPKPSSHPYRLDGPPLKVPFDPVADPPDAAQAFVTPDGKGYRFLECIGRGGFAEVHRGEAPGGVPVAIKKIIEPIDNEQAKNELQSLELIKRLRHPFLLATHAYWLSGGRLYIVMELADGTLRDRLRERPGAAGLPPEELISYMAQAAQAVDYLHGQGVLHRDIKPANILLVQGFVKVGDFGLARVLMGQQASVSGSGTMAYMPPEVWRGRAGPQSDQYSLALTYAELRLGRLPFPGRTPIEVMENHLKHAPELSSLPAAEQRVLLRALAKEPEQRYDSCSEFVHALQEALVQEQVLSALPGPHFPRSFSAANSEGASAGGADGGAAPGDMPSLSARPTASAPGLGAAPTVRPDDSLPAPGWDSDRGAPGDTSHVSVPSSISWASLPNAPAPRGWTNPASPRGSQEAASPLASRRWLAALILVGLALVPVVALGARIMRGDPSPATDAGQDVQPTQPITTPPTPVPPPGGVGANGHRPDSPKVPDLIPRFPQQDFGLKVEMLGSRPDGTGTHSLVEGEKVTFRIEVERDAYVGIWTVAPDETITQLFPNEHEPDYRIRAHEPRNVPGRDYVIEATFSGGVERVWVAASTVPWDVPQGQREGPFLVFKTAKERQHLKQQLRGLVLKPAPKGGKAAVADQVLMYRVSRRAASAHN